MYLYVSFEIPMKSTAHIFLKFIMRYACGELGELEEDMRRAFHSHFKKDINVKEKIGVMLTSSFDGMKSDELNIEQIVHGSPEYSQWESRS